MQSGLRVQHRKGVFVRGRSDKQTLAFNLREEGRSGYAHHKQRAE